MNFEPIDNSGRVEGYCLVKAVEQKTSSKGDSYLDFTLGDQSGEINAKLWRYDVATYGEYRINDIVKVRGTVSAYNGADQLRIERIRLTTPADNVRIEDFVQSAAYSSVDMYNEIMDIISAFSDSELKALVTAVYTDRKEQLLYFPAAFKLHHAMRGGLLFHTLSIIKLCEGVCKVYPFADRELLIAGAALHDIAKIDEFVVGETGAAEGYSVEGNLLGHLTMGATLVDKYAEKLGIGRRTAVLIEHMLLSHHGEPDYGAAVRPMFIEAQLLSQLDLIDACVWEMRDAVSKAPKDDFSAKIWALDNRKFFNHDRTDLSADANLLNKE